MIMSTRMMMTGTPKFQSLEQLGAHSVSSSSDIYAFGGIMTILFTEKPAKTDCLSK